MLYKIILIATKASKINSVIKNNIVLKNIILLLYKQIIAQYNLTVNKLSAGGLI